MLTLYRMNGVLHALCRVNLKRPVTFNNEVYDNSLFGKDHHIEVDAVIAILTENGCIRIFNGDKFVKFGLGEFTDIILKKEYLVEDKEEIVHEPQPESTVVEEEPLAVEEPVEEDIEEEVVDDQKENKKKRHKNNQGGDK